MAQPNSASLAQSWSVNPSPALISCPLGLWSSALPGCAVRVRCLGSACALGLGTAWVLCLCALLVCAAWALCLGNVPVRGLGVVPVRGLGAACARGLGAACAHGLWALPVHAAWALPVHAAWALPVHAACALSTRSWQCAYDHQPMCAGLECPMPQISFCSLHCPQCLKALVLAIRTHIRIPHLIPHVKPTMPYFS